jgi:hypothetical protein
LVAIAQTETVPCPLQFHFSFPSTKIRDQKNSHLKDHNFADEPALSDKASKGAVDQLCQSVFVFAIAGFRRPGSGQPGTASVSLSG